MKLTHLRIMLLLVCIKNLWCYLKLLFRKTLWICFATFTLSACSEPPQQNDIIGNMNGVKLTVPYGYQEYGSEYSGESVWKPLKNPPERTYQSGLDSISISAKYPSMQHKNENNNLQSYYRSAEHPGSSKEWLSITVQSEYENKSPEAIQAMEEFKRTKGGLKGIILPIINNGVWLSIHPDDSNRLDETYTKSADGVYTKHELLTYVQRFEPALGLHHAIATGPRAREPQLRNNDYYWVGDATLTGKVTTEIDCVNGVFAPTVSAFAHRCTHRYEIPELHADVVIYYHLDLLPHWQDIQTKTQALILSFKHQPSTQGINHD